MTIEVWPVIEPLAFRVRPAGNGGVVTGTNVTALVLDAMIKIGVSVKAS